MRRSDGSYGIVEAIQVVQDPQPMYNLTVDHAHTFIVKYEQVSPTAMECLNRDMNACLIFYRFPQKHWKYIQTSNIIERLFSEVKKRSHKMSAGFRNEESCLLMLYAVIRSVKLRKIAVPAKAAETSEFLHNN